MWPEKWGTSDVAVQDRVGRGMGLPLLQIAGEETGWSRVDTEGSNSIFDTEGHRGFAGESESLRGGLATDRSKYVGNQWFRLCTREKILLWCRGHSHGIRSAGRK